MRKTKIIATIGDNHIWSSEMLKQAAIEGVDIFRLSSSFNTDDSFFHKIRKNAPNVKILQDLNEGVKKRINTSTNVIVTKGDIIRVNLKEMSSNSSELSVNWLELNKSIKNGDIIYVGDGEVAMKVTDVKEEYLICEILNDGLIKKRKALNINGIESGVKAINSFNKESIMNGAKLGYDIVAISFVSSKSDILDFIDIIKEINIEYNPLLIAKIETELGVKNIDDILDVADGVMIARGDLALQIDFKLLGVIQKRLIEKCKRRNKICIVATQMLESIMQRYIPSRAEILDISNAVYNGVDAVMLSPESCINPYPLVAIKTMKEIIENVENDLFVTNNF